jgi:5-methylcytosine-specific restriction endonuclease McrA
MTIWPKPKDQKRGQKPWLRIFSDGREWIDRSTTRGKMEFDARHLNAWDRDHGICGICLERVSWEDSVADHIKPKGHGGAFHDDRESNLQPSHAICNLRKGSRRI